MMPKRNNCKLHFRSVVRILVVLCLLVMAVLIGGGAFWILTNLQNQSQREHYDAITRKIESSTLSIVMDKQDALTTGTALALEKCPDAKHWPFCEIPLNFYQSILNPLFRITQVRSITTATVIMPSQVSAFEAFAYNFYAQQGHPELGISPFGKGIFAMNETTGERFHDTTGTTGHGKRTMLLVVFQVTNLAQNTLVFMHNTYSERTRSQALDYVFDCVERYGGTALNCTAITGIVFLVQDFPSKRPSALTFVPIILPRSSKIVGVMAAVHNWDIILKSGAHEEADGIMAVLSDGASSYTYLYNFGGIVFIGEGDRHDSAFDSDRVSFAATPFGGPIRYTVALYPTKQWVKHHVNNVPLFNCLIIVGLVVFTTIVFTLYDFLINRHSVHQDQIMQTKRLYVRYISHEIRTPLNVVHLGFQILFVEMKKLLSASNNVTANKSFTKSRQGSDSTLPLPWNAQLDRTHQQTVASSSQDSAETRADLNDRHNSCSSLVEESANQRCVWSARIGDWLDVVGDVVDSLNAAIAVLNDLIDYDKIDSGSMNLQQEELALWSFIETSVHPFIVQARAKNIDMQILNQLQDERMENDTNKLLLIGDRVKLSQVLRNLVANALKFTEEGGQIIVSTKWETMSSPEIPSQPSHFMDRCHPCLKRSCRQRRNGSHNIGIQEQSSTLANKYVPAGQVSISVTDTGAGLSAEHIQQLFQEGVQFNPNNLQGGQGSGLGLCITKGIVDAHCGHLLVSSEGEGNGTTFKVMLPIFLPVASMVNSDHVLIEDDICARPNEGETPAFDSVDVLPKKEALDVLLQSTVYERFHNLLVVDDSAVNRKMMCRSLQAVGFRCFQAVDGLECVEIVRKVLNNEHEPINLILMDYEMPGMNGPTACAALSTLKCDIPVIGVTGNVLNEDKQTFLEHGAIEVLQKPFLISTFESILKRRIESNNKK